MKAFIFLLFMVAIVSALVWKLRKSRAEEARARRSAIEHRKKRDKESLSQDADVVWPVIIRPVRGEPETGAGDPASEPSMTSIEYEPPEKMAS